MTLCEIRLILFSTFNYRLNYVTTSTNCDLAMELLLYAFEFRQLYKNETVVSSFCALGQDSF